MALERVGLDVLSVAPADGPSHHCRGRRMTPADGEARAAAYVALGLRVLAGVTLLLLLAWAASCV